MGLAPGLALSAIRISVGELSEVSEIEAFLGTVRSLYNRLRV
jgi:cysteine sulfinate desulfinase/cysteine desulfurase-like protein